MDTIFAEATPPGKGGVSIVRLSGPQARAIAARLAGDLPASHQAGTRRLRDGDDAIDEALVLAFDAGRSFTGDETVEFHLHGAPVVVSRLSAALRKHGARQAAAGEFTQRAFLAGRLDLTQVQGLSDLLAAETEAQRRLAVQNASGLLGKRATEWREALSEAGALLLADIDFPDEDLENGLIDAALERIVAVRESIEATLAGSAAAEIVRKGFQVAIVGPPNAGKSTLLNRLAGRDVAIVSERPGTTRDVIEVRLDLNGAAVSLFDTAGLRDSDDVVEGEGIARARRTAEAADLRIHLSETGEAQAGLLCPGDLVVTSKADLHPGDGLRVSAQTGAGLDALVSEIGERLAQRIAGAGVVAHEMQRDRLARAARHLREAERSGAEFLAEALWQAIHELEALVGRVDIEDYLDLVFSRFCIGK
ncbi:tRNA uridine-5-carboxymethylaminomethyl(34) synthesis GTPase MnmE [Paracoccus sp. S-4012]|uniref:tRNA uridine-5-carboxymethylaminomethyl(34) synthesis GTPase MnmE n=1 Tax=Paracoccus sp. S-4012 TaxID=2665648 RepID=UPI0012B05BB8|nr:tRNA uridine-5-carboxymethylaminomethyl(34) synthesis GTPase MnmE [Paracoccus sp. S-4012]MRX49859.1 tRNA uridine-5-carboxymethylaminomethyl(34) synthesis GTPase MnmE [Paracoccus sp. S-4012]